MILKKNIIKKLTVEMEVPSMEQALRFKDDIDSFLKEVLYPKLSMVFSLYPSDLQVFELEELRVAIDVNNTAHNKVFNTEIAEKISQQLKQKLTQESFKEKNYQPTQKTLAEKEVEAFIYFLKNGRYPWWRELSKAINISEISTVQRPYFQESFKFLFQSSTAQKRLIYQFDNTFITNIYRLINSIGNEMGIPIKDIPNILQKENVKEAFWMLFFTTENSVGSTIFQEWFFEFLKVTFGETTASSEAIFTVPEKNHTSFEEVLQFCQKNLQINLQLVDTAEGRLTLAFSKKPQRIALRKHENIVFEKQKLITNFSQKIRGFSTETQLEKATKNTDIQTLNTADEIFQKIEEPVLPTENIEELLIQNAGLILLHPFLKKFFEKQGFLSQNTIKEEKKPVAVHLLHYLATGIEKAPEQQLVFEKYLCEIPLQSPIKKEVNISSSQKTAAEELLLAVLHHWKALKTNNIKVLQNEFLQREGKLQHKNDQHQLYIERKTQDILLEHIPWNIHLMKLPWQKQLLLVDW